MMLQKEDGQITVFLALLLTIMIGISLCVLDGMKAYTESSLTEDALKGAGNYVLASYDRYLFQNYHVFFMDPREKTVLVSDGEEYLSEYMNRWSFFDFSCSQLSLTEEKTAVEEDGLYLKHQIREWMKYREIAVAVEELKELMSSTENVDDEKDNATEDMGDAKKEIDSSDSSQDDQESSGDSTQLQKVDSGSSSTAVAEQQQESQEKARTKAQWKEMVSSMNQILDMGILFYVVDNINDVSNASISTEILPSTEHFSQPSNSDGDNPFGSSFSFTDVNEWTNALNDMDLGTTVVDTFADELYLLQYISDCFRSYIDEKSGDSALKYEMEYLLYGKSTDQDNLKAMANRLLCIRFIVNYAYLSTDVTWKATTETTAEALLGLVGLPEVGKAIQVLLTAAVSLAESMLDVHALFAGEEIPVTKSKDTWNLSLANAGTLLSSKGSVKKGKVNVSYEDFLNLFMVIRPVMTSKKLTYRMMDIMQVNTALEEEGFLMKECLFAFCWEAQFSCKGWFSFFPGTGVQGIGKYDIKLDRLNSY